MTGPVIKTAKAPDEDRVVDVLVLAFMADPAVRWAWSDPQKYLLHFPSFARAFGGRAFTHGSAYYADDYAGAALLAVSLGLLILGALQGGQAWAWNSPVSIAIFAAQIS